MWKLVVYGFFISNIFASTPKINSKTNEHFLKLNKEFPYALLTDDFGILNREDLATNSCMGEPVPFINKNLAFPYWQCFEVQNAKLICENMGPYENSNEQSALMIIKIHSNEKSAEYLNRRGIKMRDCANFRKIGRLKPKIKNIFVFLELLSLWIRQKKN